MLGNMKIWDRYENLSPEEYLSMIRPYLRDLINEHIPSMELNNNNNDNNKIIMARIVIKLIIIIIIIIMILIVQHGKFN